ncbi:MAG: hypothetical protein J6X19_04145, partial [Clostridia bacterium]|nr:hypothetical protein [Clostridia bacterium]
MGTDINMDSDKKNKRKLTGTGLWRILFGTVLAAFTLYAVLDTFVIPRNMQTGADTLNLAMFGTAEPAATDTSATAATAGSSAAASATPEPSALLSSEPQEDIVIEYKEYYQNGTAIYVADVRLSSAQYLRTAFARDTYGRNVTAYTSS